jgi:hypothetical protein
MMGRPPRLSDVPASPGGRGGIASVALSPKLVELRSPKKRGTLSPDERKEAFLKQLMILQEFQTGYDLAAGGYRITEHISAGTQGMSLKLKWRGNR